MGTAIIHPVSDRVNL